MAEGDFAGSLLRGEGEWTGTMPLKGEEIPVLLTTIPYFEDMWEYVLYRSDIPKSEALGEAWSRWQPDGTRHMEIKLYEPESYFQLRQETGDRWVLTETLPCAKPKREPEPETWPSHYESRNRSEHSDCERCGVTFNDENLSDCKECGVTFCYKCGRGDYCNLCAEDREERETPSAPKEDK